MSVSWKDVANAVGNAAPLIGSLIGPGGTAVGAGVKTLISSVLGTDNSPEAVLQALKSDPQALVKLKQAEMDHQVDLQKLVVQQEQLHLADIADARARDTAIVQAVGGNTRGDILAFIAISGLVGLVTILLFVSIPVGPSKDILLLLSGALVAIVKDVYSFEFGSSRGSKNKDNTIARLAKSGEANAAEK